jgi:hypothetical protein
MPPSPAQKPSRPPDDHDGQTNPYVILSEIGKGSFATVYKGYHQARPIVSPYVPLSSLIFLQDTHDHVAIKSVRRDKLKAKLLDNLQSEIQILKALSHRHITKLIEIVVRSLSSSSSCSLIFCLCHLALPELYIPHHRVLLRRRLDQLYQDQRPRRILGVCPFPRRCPTVLSTPAYRWTRNYCCQKFSQATRLVFLFSATLL